MPVAGVFDIALGNVRKRNKTRDRALRRPVKLCKPATHVGCRAVNEYNADSDMLWQFRILLPCTADLSIEYTWR
jgi:hypothetical protein